MKELTKQFSTFIAVLAVCTGVLAITAEEGWAADSALLLPVNGFLSDAEEQPIDGDVEVTFSLYANATADAPFWSETHDMQIHGGSFSAYLGSFETLDADIFQEYRAPYVAIQVEDDAEMDRWPVGHVPFAAVAERADDAQTLQGMTPEELAADNGNGGAPTSADQIEYDDTTSQLGADDSQAAIEALAGRLDQLEQDLAAAESERDDLANTVSQVEAAQSTMDSRIDSTETELEAHDGRLTSVENQIDEFGDQDARLTAVEDDLDDVEALASGFDGRITAVEDVTAPMSRTDINGQDSVAFDGVNVHVRSGSGSTSSSVNGRGNLIVGYDEGVSGDKTGSHNIVMGTNNSYSSYGGLVGGNGNTISGNYTSVLGGTGNTADGTNSVVVAGSGNETTGTNSAILAGASGEAGGNQSAIIAGWENETSGSWSAVVAGSGNEAAAMDSVVVGGLDNTASNTREVVVD